MPATFFIHPSLCISLLREINQFSLQNSSRVEVSHHALPHFEDKSAEDIVSSE